MGQYKVEKDKRGSYGKGEYNKSFTFVGEEIEKIMKDNPESNFLKVRQNMKILVYSYAMPLNDLIQQYGQSLSIRETRMLIKEVSLHSYKWTLAKCIYHPDVSLGMRI